MATIKFETGQTVNFEGNPTQNDIEEVALRLNIGQGQELQQPQQPQQFKQPIKRQPQ